MEVKVIGEAIHPDEKKIYVDYVKEKVGKRELESVTIKVDGEYVDLEWTLKDIPFERIRRITGYLVGNMNRWNDGKRAEEHDRVKHTTVEE